MKGFLDFSIRPAAVALLHRQGIEEATPVQEAAIPVVRSGRDAIVQAPTGTGKTLAFLLPILEKLKPNAMAVQALVVTPTRELTVQIARVANALAPLYGVHALALYGGQDIERQKEKIRRQPQLLIGTPGRLLDHLRHHTLRLDTVNKVVLDEADEMLKLGFIEDVETLLQALAKDRQLLLFSATIPERIRKLAHRFMRRPEEIAIKGAQVTLDTIHQVTMEVKEPDKLDRLSLLINETQPYLMMVFCATREKVRRVTYELIRRGYLADELSGDLTQAQRALVLRRFRQAALQILVTTDIAARGLDIEGVTHVVNYDLPRTTEDYIHRIGRTGRAGRTGEAVTFVTARQYEALRRIEAGIRARITRREATRRTETVGVRRERVDVARPGQSATSKPLPKAKRTATPLSKYANRKGADHKGRNPRSRRQKSGRGNAPQAPKGKKKR